MIGVNCRDIARQFIVIKMNLIMSDRIVDVITLRQKRINCLRCPAVNIKNITVQLSKETDWTTLPTS